MNATLILRPLFQPFFARSSTATYRSILWGCLAIGGCTSTSPGVILIPISGRTFNVVSVDGRLLPTTIGVSAMGACSQVPIKRVTLMFVDGGSFVESKVSTNDAISTISGSFSEPKLGTVAIVNSRDTATVAAGTMRVRLTADVCANEVLVAQAM